MVVIPRGLLASLQPAWGVGNGFSEDPVARREIEIAAMNAVMAAERSLGNEPDDVSARKLGYDIASRFGVSIMREQEDAAALTHNLRTAVIDPRGRLVKVYCGSDWTPAMLVEDLREARGRR